MSNRRPAATVGALILNPRGQILLVQSPKWHHYWTVPGGHIEWGERAEAAVRREIQEEVGLRITVPELLLVQQAIFAPQFYRRRHFIFLDYLCCTRQHTAHPDGREITRARWLRPQQALRLPLEPFSRRLIRAYLDQRAAGALPQPGSSTRPVSPSTRAHAARTTSSKPP